MQSEMSLTSTGPLFCVRYERNPHFSGRKALLRKLHEILHDENCRNYKHRVALHGLGGVGKTQLALEYAYTHQSVYNSVFWISAVDQPRLLSGFGDIARVCQHAILGKSPVDIAKSVLEWLCNLSDKWLLVIDNLDVITLIKDYLPSTN